MHICFVINSDIRTNASGKRAFGMAKYLPQRGWETSLILQDHPAHREYAKQLPGVNFVYHAVASPLTERREKTELLRRGGYDVAVVCSLSVRNGVQLSGPNSPLMILDHPEIMSSFEDRSWLRRCWDGCGEWRAMWRYDGHLAVSRYLERRLIHRLARLRRPQHVLYSPFAADDELRLVDHEGVQKVRLRYRKKIVVYIGTFIEAYGFHEMLAAAALLAEKRRDFTLVLAGDGPELETGKQFVRRKGITDVVDFPGFLLGDGLSNYLHAADAFICPLSNTVRDWSRSPGKIYMYGITGRPIVTCRIGEAIDTLGDGGFYYAQGDVVSLADRLGEALDYPADTPAAYSRDNLFWDGRTHEFLGWLKSAFGIVA